MNERKKVVVIGGGHGTSVVMSGLKAYDLDLNGVFAMADNGGSTGRLRQQINASAVGDIRQCLVKLSDQPELADIFAYRLNSGEMNGHSLGNLFLAAGEAQTGSLEQSIELAKQALKVKANLAPVTNDKCQLLLQLPDSQVEGVYQIANTDFNGQKPQLSLTPQATLSSSAAKALAGADLIIIAPGNFYCSIMAALLVDGLAKAINDAAAKVVMIANLVNRAEHTRGYTLDDYVNEINRLSGGINIDTVIYNTAEISAECLREGEEQVAAGDSAAVSYEVIGQDIADDRQVSVNAGDEIAAVRSLAQHDPQKLTKIILEILDTI